MSSDRPNILILATDQQRADSLGCAGHPQVRTPNMDRLAAEGVRFTRAITVSPLCMPSRISFVTGQYPHNHHVWWNRGDVAEGDVSLFRLLRAGRYRTAMLERDTITRCGNTVRGFICVITRIKCTRSDSTMYVRSSATCA